MQAPTHARRFLLSVSAALSIGLISVACGGSASAGWTYAPLGPTPEATAAPTAGGSEAPSSPGGPGENVAIVTPADNPLTYDPPEFTVSAGSEVTIAYTNESNLPHDIVTFSGADNTSEQLGSTEVITGPGAQSSMTFTAPADPGDYFFWCSVHQSAMTGTYHVQ